MQGLLAVNNCANILHSRLTPPQFSRLITTEKHFHNLFLILQRLNELGSNAFLIISLLPVG